MISFHRISRLLLLGFAVFAFGGEGSAQIRASARIVIASGVACRAEPSATAQKINTYGLGAFVTATMESEVDGATWYFVTAKSPSCWIFGPLTTEWHSDRQPMLLAVVDHLLSHSTEARFEDYVAVENLLTESSEVVASSGLLQFRKLELINQALSLKDVSGPSLEEDPLKKAWVLSHGDLVFFFDPDAAWYIRPDAYWSLYEKNKNAPWAEELAWTAAEIGIPSDECYSACVLDKIDRKWLQYWTRYPHGSKIKEALEQATPPAKYAADLACYDPSEPDYSVPRQILDKMRSSLADVTETGKIPFLQYIDGIERKCFPEQRQR
jgi:hypothetical protein